MPRHWLFLRFVLLLCFFTFCDYYPDTSSMDLGLTDRVALVTGGSQGIGAATAQLFGREHARVALTYFQNREAAENVAESIRAAGGSAMISKLDLGSPESIVNAIDAVIARWGRLDILVNSAIRWGTPGPSLTLEEMPDAEWKSALRINIEGTFTVIKEVLPHMFRQSWGRIVTVSATSAVDGRVGFSWYSAAKSALHGLTRTVFLEAGPHGVLMNVIMPGLTATEKIMANLPAGAREYAAAQSPIGRLLQPAEVGQAIVFLCSSANTSITGEIIRTSGGT
jgi:3-oxoacyl-[acyl-carrier protein] reductase